MIVTITNLTDGPGQSPVQIDIWNKTLGPGDSLKLPAELVDSKLRGLEKQGLVSIGPAPAWYDAFKSKKGSSISQEEKKRRMTYKPPAPVVEEPMAAMPMTAMATEDTVVHISDEISVERRRKQR
jgi:hypothetical protein